METLGGTLAIFQANDCICQTRKVPSSPRGEGLAKSHIVSQPQSNKRWWPSARCSSLALDIGKSLKFSASSTHHEREVDTLHDRFFGQSNANACKALCLVPNNCLVDVAGFNYYDC